MPRFYTLFVHATSFTFTRRIALNKPRGEAGSILCLADGTTSPQQRYKPPSTLKDRKSFIPQCGGSRGPRISYHDMWRFIVPALSEGSMDAISKHPLISFSTSSRMSHPIPCPALTAFSDTRSRAAEKSEL
eukprot:gb/GECG01013138.1/.p1 GENE.gb/GECG01013138.1/~~gb/GECG01013138.1/.p1  ORF type:complete len:131 (+),score=3.07 gb/GECG01013138.1/:1-393(+)